MKKLFFILLIISALLIPGAMAAGNFTNADTWLEGQENEIAYFSSQTDVYFDLTGEQKAVTLITIDDITPGRIDFTLTMGSDEIHTGYINYTRDLFTADFSIGLDGNTKDWSALDNFLAKAYISTYATNQDTNTDGILLYESWLTNLANLQNYVFSPDPYISNFPITKIEIHSENPIKTTVAYASIVYVKENIEEGTGSANYLTWVYKLIDFVSQAFGVIPTLLYAFYFIFISHFFEIIILYEIVIASYTAYHSRDIISFLKKFSKANINFLDFWMGFVDTMIGIFAKIIQALKFW